MQIMMDGYNYRTEKTLAKKILYKGSAQQREIYMENYFLTPTRKVVTY